MDKPLMWWVFFNLFVLAMLALDLGVFHRKAHEVKFKEAIGWSIVWIALALIFNLGIYMGWFGGYDEAVRGVKAKEFLVGYIVEKALSIDNVFVFAMIFTYFAVPAAYQHKVLFYGIVGALIFRAIFILGGTWLISQFEWMLYLFALLLVLTGFKMVYAKLKGAEPDPGKNPVVRLAKRLLPMTNEYHGEKFAVRDATGKLLFTPLFLVLLLVETTDIIFAVDSIPAILIITQDTFIVYTSNVFAILGLRALYFALAGFMNMFAYLTYGLAAILVFIGGKMFYQAAVKSMTGVETKVPIEMSLGVIAVTLIIAVALSMLFPPREKPQHAAGAGVPGGNAA